MQSIGNKILEAARAKHPKGYHPRVIMTAEDFARLRDNRDNGIYKPIVECVLREADKTMDMPPEQFRIPDGIRLLFVAQEVQRRVIYHSLAYHITGEEKYAARAVKEIEAAAAFPDFNPRHFLDCSEMTLAFGLCFDWLYDYLTEEKKKLILDTIAEKSFFAIKEEFDDVKEHKNATIPLRGYRWYQDKPGDNWKMVCDGSFVATILAIHDAIEDDFCETILTNCFEDTYQAVRDFYDEQDGTYSEGVNYWTYATRFLAFFSKALETAAGSDFGLTDYVGVARSPYWLFALSSPDYMCFNFGDAHSIRITSPMFSWLADRYNDPALYAIRKKDIEAGRADYMDALYFRDVPYVEPSSIPLSFGRVGGDNASFRTDIGEKALYAAIHLAKNHAYHGHRDMGTFVVNIGDKRFFVDLGADNYNLAPGYGMCYRYRAEGHNTVIFNPSPEHDQARIANCVIHRFSDGEESFAISDMSEAYPGRSVLRGMKLCRADQSIIIQDEIECKTEDVIRWSAHTPASVRLYESGKAAVLDIDGVKMYAKILTDGVFEVRAAAADENSPVVWNPNATEETPPERRGQALNNGTQKLMIHLSGKSSRRIAVWLKPLADGTRNSRRKALHQTFGIVVKERKKVMQSIGAKILAATKERHPNHHHPRLIMTEADFARLREKRGEGAYKCMLDKIIAEADKTLDLPPRKYEIPDGVRLLVTSRAVLTRLMHLCYAYHTTGEEKYAARAVIEIEATVAFPDWHPRHFLDCAELCAAIAFAYDWLYDYLSEDLKAAVRAAIIKNGFNAVMEEYNNEPEHKNVLDPNRGYRWYQDKPGDNWKMVCNGGLTLAVLAIFDEIECDLCETILNHAYDDTYEAVRKFYDEQDGTYSEGVGYWSYATRYLSFYSAGLQTAAGSDFGLTDWQGLARSPYFLLSMSSPNYIGFNFGDAVETKITSPLFSWCAARFNDPALYAIRKKDIEEGKSDFVDVLYFRDVPEVPLKDMPLAFGRPGADNATFRTSATSDALFAGIHFAKNNAYHGHKDMGTFILNIGAKRFFIDLGMDNYNLKPYRGCYRFRAEGHNTIIFNPSPENDQLWEAGCTTDRFFNCEDYGFAIADMSAAYPERSVVRGMMLHRPSGSVLIQDEIECKAEDVIRWSAHTPASVSIAEDGKTAVLDMEGTKLFAEILTDGVFEVTLGRADENSPVVQPAPREHNPEPAPQKDNEGVSRLFVLLGGKERHRIAIRFTEMTEAEIAPAEVKPLSLWS